MFYLTHFIYSYIASDIWLRTILIVRKETRCRHIGYCFQLAASVLLNAPSHRHDSTYLSLCYTSRGALAGTRNSSLHIQINKYVGVYIYIYIYIYMCVFLCMYVHNYMYNLIRHTHIFISVHVCISTGVGSVGGGGGSSVACATLF